uniref:Reverse transcriptase domain-containing protein n=1 Tax=Tanacetum cinerariifolium TaxID=118510 RepID=A0A6L2KSX5_TANCI|nr:reverse transcriptase domain-containing protein [Tanacetum cinerariifolium]
MNHSIAVPRGDQGLHSSKNSIRSPREISFDYRVPLGFGSIAGGLDHVNIVIRLPIELGISRGTRTSSTKQKSSVRLKKNPPQHMRIAYSPILNINYIRRILDILQNYNPMDDEPMWAADRVVALKLGSTITIPETANEFSIKGNQLTIVKGNQFDGRTKTDPYKHVHEFLEICDMMKYRDTKNEVVHLMMFPLSLTGEAKT